MNRAMRMLPVIILALSFLFPSVAAAFEVMEVGEYTWWYTVADGKAMITRGDSWSYYPAVYPVPDGAVEIPCTLGGYPVSGVDRAAFYGCHQMTSVTIPSSVTSIGNSAFYGCSGLTSVTIPSSVTSIGNSAFEGCSGLTSVTIPEGVTSIGNSAFYNCNGLTSVTISSTVTNIGDHAFQGCTGITCFSVDSANAVYCSKNGLICSKDGKVVVVGVKGDVVVPEGVTSIGASAFAGCNGLTSVAIPSSVTSIGDRAFYNCSGLTSVTIPSSVTSIGDRAFYNCNGLTSVAIPSSVTSIGDAAFYNCNGLTSVTISEGVTSIGVSAFYNCNGLTSVTIPSSVTSIGDWAFRGCTGLGDGVVIVDGCVLTVNEDCPVTVDLPKGVRLIAGGAFEDCCELESVTIPEGVTSIGDYAFCNCNGLTSVTIPSSVTSIGAYAFAYCDGLTSVTIPSSVTSIGASAFAGCYGLTSVTIPSSVTSIGASAFAGCGIGELTIPRSVLELGVGFFNGGILRLECPMCRFVDEEGECLDVSGDPAWLSSVLDPSSNYIICSDEVAAEWEEAIVNGGFNLQGQDIYYSWTAYGWQVSGRLVGDRILEATMSYVKPLAWDGTETLTLPSSFGSFPIVDLASVGFEGPVGRVVIPEGYECIGDYAFSGCEGLLSVTIPSSVTRIGEYAFSGCTGLGEGVVIADGCVLTVNGDCPATVDLPKGVRLIAGGAFADCCELESVTIPSSVTSIGEYAFFGCTGLGEGVVIADGCVLTVNGDCPATVDLPKDVRLIAGGAFADCCELKSVTIPTGVTRIENRTFYGCKRLTAVTMPEGLTSIGAYAFSGCSCLKSVTLPSTLTGIGAYAFESCDVLTLTVPPSVRELGMYFVGGGILRLDCPRCGFTDDYGFVRDCGARDPAWLSSVLDPSSTYIICSDEVAAEWEEAIVNGEFNDPECQYCWTVDGTTVFGRIVEECVVDAEVVCSSEGKLKDETMLLPNFVGPFPIVGLARLDPNGYCIRLVVVPAEVAYVGDNAFAGCASLERVYYLGNAPACGDEIYADTPETLVSCVRNGSTGWISEESVEIPDSWNERSIMYGEMSVFGPFSEIVDGLPWTYELFFSDGKTSARIIRAVDLEFGGYTGDLVVPSFLGGYRVTQIGDFAFNGSVGLLSVVIPDGVTDIGEYAFCDCRVLKEVVVPSSVTSIGSAAFSSCNALTSVYFVGNAPDDVPGDVYDFSSGVKNYVRDGTTGWGDVPGEWRSRPVMRWSTYPDKKMFEDGVYSVSEAGYNWNVEVRDGEVWIGTDNMVGIYPQPHGALAIPEELLSLPVVGLNYCAFWDAEHLTELEFPRTMKLIYGISFRNCASLKRVAVDAANPYYEVQDGFLIEKDRSAVVLAVGKTGSCTVPDGVRVIDSDAFLNQGMTELTLPGSVENFSVNGVDCCAELVSIVVSEDNLHFKSVNGMLLDWEGKSLIACPGGLVDVVVPDGVETLGREFWFTPDWLIGLEGPFPAEGKIRSIRIPSSVSQIAGDAFSGVESLKEILVDRGNEAYTAANGLLLTADGKHVLDVAGGLGRVVVPEGVTHIDGTTFGMTHISSVVLPSSLKVMDPGAFYFSPYLISVCFEGDAPEIVKYEFDLGDEDKLFEGDDFVTVYVREGTTGWGDVPGEWHGRPLRIWTGSEPTLMPDVGGNVDFAVAVLSGSADQRVADAVMETALAEGEEAGVALYENYRDWAGTVKGSSGDPVGPQGVCDSPAAWTSFALDSATLLETNLTDEDLVVEEFKPAAESGKFDFTVSIADVKVGPKALASNLKKTFGLEGATELVQSAFDETNVDIEFGKPENGNLKFTAVPNDKNAKSFFMKMKVK